MASWFSSGAFSTLSDIKNKVQSSVTNIDPDIIKKLTLQSPELAAERERIEKEEKRKELVRDSLAEILPWETRDSEMEILVDECKDVILGLSSKEETFTGPFVLSGGLPDAEESGAVEGSEKNESNDLKIAQLSADKLSKLQPLPSLLADFDLDTHVGLIQRLFQVDPKLVQMHSRLSSGGEREQVFWKNYFFHCAYTRYEAGLSIDEIWSTEPRSSSSIVVEKAEDLNSFDDLARPQSEEEVTFDSTSSTTSRESYSNQTKLSTDLRARESEEQILSSPTESSVLSLNQKEPIPGPLVTPGLKEGLDSSPLSVPTTEPLVEPESGADYEFVSNTGRVAEDAMDELEAEIAAALDD